MAEAVTKKKKRRGTSGKMVTKLLFGLVMVFLLAAAVMIYFEQEAQIARIQTRAEELSVEVEKAREKLAENQKLYEKINTPEYIEKVARDELGMVKPGETVYPDK